MGLKEGNEFTDNIRVICVALIFFAATYLSSLLVQIFFGYPALVLVLSVIQLLSCAVVTILFGRLGLGLSITLSSIASMMLFYDYLNNDRTITLYALSFAIASILLNILLQIFMGTVYSRMFRVKNLYNQARTRISKLSEENSGERRNDVPAKSIIVRHEDHIPADSDNIAVSDPLTTLPNRYKIISMLENWIDDRISLMQSNGGINDDIDYGISIIYIYIKDFMPILHIAGHHTTDLYIQGIAHRLRESIHPQDILGRVTNGEFIVIAKRTLSDEEYREYAELLTSVIAKSFSHENHKVDVATAIGLARFPDNARFSSDLISCAEFAMNAGAQTAGRGNNSSVTFDEVKEDVHHIVYTTHFKGETLKRMEEKFPLAMRNEEIYVVYQPQYDQDGQLTGFEAFLRWYNEELGKIKAIDFLQLAEKCGLIYELGKYCIDNAVSMLSRINKKNPNLKMTINVSESELKNGSVPGIIADAIAKYNVNASNVVIDIPEECLTSSFSEVRPTINYIASLGVKMTLDNFGRGYSSLNNIPLMPISEIKLDSIFTRKLMKDEIQAILTASIIGLMHEIDIKVCATGVSSSDIFNELRSFGCDCYQGAYLHKPMKAEEVPSFLKESKVLLPAWQQEGP